MPPIDNNEAQAIPHIHSYRYLGTYPPVNGGWGSGRCMEPALTRNGQQRRDLRLTRRQLSMRYKTEMRTPMMAVEGFWSGPVWVQPTPGTPHPQRHGILRDMEIQGSRVQVGRKREWSKPNASGWCSTQYQGPARPWRGMPCPPRGFYERMSARCSMKGEGAGTVRLLVGDRAHTV